MTAETAPRPGPSRTPVPRAVLGAALRQARTTLVRKYTTAGGISTLVLAAVLLVVLWVLRDRDLGGGAVATSGYILTGFLAFGIVAAAVMGVAGELQTEREDGTLLRAKAVPHGMTGHLLAKLVVTPVDALVPVVPAVVGAAVLLPGVMPADLGSWLMLALVYLLAVAAMMPWGDPGVGVPLDDGPGVGDDRDVRHGGGLRRVLPGHRLPDLAAVGRPGHAALLDRPGGACRRAAGRRRRGGDRRRVAHRAHADRAARLGRGGPWWGWPWRPCCCGGWPGGSRAAPWPRRGSAC
ncbi:hypothetical protein [Ornithinimicrobium sp. W1665]|uniref:hypothetical protein n=1 Tax=Ornithinimicrobium sp. W1665 TaxID=3416666 RepID=UPI003D6C317C